MYNHRDTMYKVREKEVSYKKSDNATQPFKYHST